MVNVEELTQYRNPVVVRLADISFSKCDLLRANVLGSLIDSKKDCNIFVYLFLDNLIIYS